MPSALPVVIVATLLAMPRHAGASPGAPGGASEGSATVVLGLDADDPAIGAELTAELRRAIGDTSARAPTLADARRAEGCTGDEPECLARVGRSLGAEQLVFGRLRREGGGHTLELSTLDVETATIEVRDRFPLTAAQVRRAELAQTADVIAAAMVDGADDIDPAPARAAVPPPLPGRDRPAAPPAPPVPRWKPALFATSLALTGVGLAGAITLSFLGRPDGKYDRAISDAQAGSVEDDKTSNDVPEGTPDSCAYAQEEVQPGAVRNAAVTRACREREDVRTAAGGAWAATAVLAATTVVFAALWHGHLRKRDRVLADRRLSLGLGPDGRGGVAMSGSVKF